MVILVIYVDNSKNPTDLPTAWLPSLQLFLEDKISVENGEWLDDRVINVAQLLLKHQFPSIDGFHSTIIVAANQAAILGGGTVQILHVGGNHWICATVSKDKSDVMIFDTLTAHH